MEHISYNSGYGMMFIEEFKRRAGLGYKQMAFGYLLFKIHCSYNTKKLKNKALLSFKQ